MIRISRIFVAAVLPLLIQSSSLAEEAASAVRVRVLSYNIHHGEGVDGKLDLKRIAGVIDSVAPDVVSLQEVDRKTERTGGVDQAEELGRLTKMKAVFGASMPYRGGEYGNAVLTKLPIVDSRCIPLPGEPRSALCVSLELPSSAAPRPVFSFIATHLDTSQTPRLKSPPLIEHRLAGFLKGPAILAGDLNAVPDSPTMRAFAKTWRNATGDEALLTFPVDEPTRQIDYLLYRPADRWKVIEVRVLEEPIASDHRPLFGVLELVAEGTE